MQTELLHLLFSTLETLIAALLPVLLGYAIARIRDQRIRDYVASLVGFAAMRIPDKSERYEYVAAQLHRKYPTIEADDIAHLIETTVLALKAGATKE